MRDDSIGVDISKDKLDCHRLSDGAFAQFSNTKAGFQKFRGWIGTAQPARVVYEPTGAYHGAFEAALADHLPLVKVNPKHARRFAESHGQLAKTDRAPSRQILPCKIACRAMDARVLAQMGAAHELEPDMPVAKDRPVLRELQAARTALIKDKVRLQNQLDKQAHRLTLKLTRRRLRQVMSDLAELGQALRLQLESCPIRKRRLHLIQSIKGIGAVAATTILIVPLGTFRSEMPCRSTNARNRKPAKESGRAVGRDRPDHKAIRPMARPVIHTRWPKASS